MIADFNTSRGGSIASRVPLTYFVSCRSVPYITAQETSDSPIEEEGDSPPKESPPLEHEEGAENESSKEGEQEDKLLSCWL
jgi:hypothetical protein